MNFRFFLFLVFGLSYFLVHAQKTHYSVLNAPTDAKSLSLGALGTATFADEFSIFHNPAKFIFFKEENAKNYQLINYSNYVAFSNAYFLSPGINQSSLSAGGLLTKFMALSGAFSLATQGIHFTETGDRNIGDFEIFLAPSFRLKDTEKHKISSGVGLRYYADLSQREYLHYFAMDLSVFYQLLLYKDRRQEENIASYSMNFGLALENLFGKIKAKNMELKAPFSPALARFAWSQYVYLKGRHFFAFHYEAKKPLIASDFDLEKDAFSALFSNFSTPFEQWYGEIQHVLGAEFSFRNMFTLRSGVLLENSKYGVNSTANFGFSFRYKMADLGFAYNFPIHTLNYLGQGFFLTLAWNFKGKT